MNEEMPLFIKRCLPLMLAAIMTLTAGGCGLVDGKKPASSTAWPDSVVDELMNRPTKIILVMKAPEAETDNIALAGTNWEVTLDKYVGMRTNRPIRIDVETDSDFYHVRLTLEDGTVQVMDGSLSPGQVELYLNATFDSTPAHAGIKADICICNSGGRKIVCQINDYPGGRITVSDRDGHPVTGTSEKENLSIVK